MTTIPPEFREAELDRFWKFVFKRHRIWHRRFVLGLPREEWTKDPILQKNKFTNIYRELDPGTVFCRTQILELPVSRKDRAFNVMIYRLMCSISTYRKVGFQYLEIFDEKKFEEKLRDIHDAGGPVFGNAYLISPYSSMGSDLKYENVARLFGQLHRIFERFFQRLDEAPTMTDAFSVVSKQYGFGPFLTYQVLVDLTYPLPNTKYGSAIIPFDQDEWTRLGPGALRGYARIAPNDYNPQGLRGIRWLRYNQREEFERLRLKFPFLRNVKDEEVEISLANMQNCLCEYSKYRNIQKGSGKAQRLFEPTTEERSWLSSTTLFG